MMWYSLDHRPLTAKSCAPFQAGEELQRLFAKVPKTGKGGLYLSPVCSLCSLFLSLCGFGFTQRPRWFSEACLSSKCYHLHLQVRNPGLWKSVDAHMWERVSPTPLPSSYSRQWSHGPLQIKSPKDPTSRPPAFSTWGLGPRARKSQFCLFTAVLPAQGLWEI